VKKSKEGMIHEKIQWFKNFYQLDREILPSETGISYKNLLWLINTIEQQQQEVEYWKKIVVNDREAFRKQRRKMQQQLQQAQIKIERYEKALKEIEKVHAPYFPEDVQKMRRIAREVLGNEW
jgi:ferritin-like protein